MIRPALFLTRQDVDDLLKDLRIGAQAESDGEREGDPIGFSSRRILAKIETALAAGERVVICPDHLGRREPPKATKSTKKPHPRRSGRGP